MKKGTKRIIAVLSSLAVSVGMLTACSTDKDGSGSKETYTYWAELPAATSQTLSSYKDMLMYQEISKVTGVNVDFIHPAKGTSGSEAFQILLASGEYPDMIEYNWRQYAGGPGQAISDGVIISLNDYIEEYAPNYYDWMEGEKGKEKDYIYKKESITIDGNYFGFTGMNVGSYAATGGLFVRYDLLKKWGLDVPVTIDDWDKVFATAKANGVERPFTCENYALGPESGERFSGAWNVANTFYVDGDVVKYGPFEYGYKELVTKFNEWAKKGYIDVDSVTNTFDEVNNFIVEGKAVASIGAIGGTMGKLIAAMEDRNPEFDIAACPFPVLKEGDVNRFQTVPKAASDPTIAISEQCGAENKDRYIDAIKWCDYIYGDEGIILKSFGIEGDTFTVEKDENGEEHYVYTDKIYDHEKMNMHSVEAALYHFVRPGNGPGIRNLDDYLDGFYPYERQKEALEVWNLNKDEAQKCLFPTVAYTEEESATIANIRATALVDFKATVINIMIGKADISTFDAAVKKVKEGGYDEYLKIQQAAYDRYNKASK